MLVVGIIGRSGGHARSGDHRSALELLNRGHIPYREAVLISEVSLHTAEPLNIMYTGSVGRLSSSQSSIWTNIGTFQLSFVQRLSLLQRVD